MTHRRTLALRFALRCRRYVIDLLSSFRDSATMSPRLAILIRGARLTT